MTTTNNDMPECGGCGSQMRLVEAHESSDIDGRFRCAECRQAEAEDAAAEREYRADRAAHAAVCGCPNGGPKTSDDCAAYAAATGKRSRGEGLTAAEWTLLGVALPFDVEPPRHDIDARCQPVKARPEGYR